MEVLVDSMDEKWEECPKCKKGGHAWNYDFQTCRSCGSSRLGIAENSPHEKGLISIISGLQDHILELQTKNAMAWIPTSDRLPDIHTIVWVLLTHKRPNGKNFDMDGMNEFGQWYVYLPERITHWMPIQEPM